MNLSVFKIKQIEFWALCAIGSLSSCNMHTKDLYGDPNNSGKNPYYNESHINQTDFELETKTNRSQNSKSMRPINITLNTNNQNNNQNHNQQIVSSNTTCCCSLPCSCCCCSMLTVLGIAGFSAGAYFGGLAWGWWKPAVITLAI